MRAHAIPRPHKTKSANFPRIYAGAERVQLRQIKSLLAKLEICNEACSDKKLCVKRKEMIYTCDCAQVAKHLHHWNVNANRWPEGSLDSAKSLSARARPLSKSNEKNAKCILVKVFLKGFQNGTKKYKTHN